MRACLIRLGLAAAFVALILGAMTFLELRRLGFFREPVYELVPPAVPALKRPAVLVFSKTNGFIHHDAIAAAKTLFHSIGIDGGWSVFLSDNGAVHNDADLSRFDVVVWNNVSGDVLTQEQRAAFRRYIERGGGVIALHGSGGDKHYSWEWWPQVVIGAKFIGHPLFPQFQAATVRIENTGDPIVTHLGKEWMLEDEWYSFAATPRHTGTRVLAVVDESTYTPRRAGKWIGMGADHPIVWKRCVAEGRVFYSALGHTADIYADPMYRQTIERALAWTGGLEGTGCKNGRPGDAEAASFSRPESTQ